MLIEHIHYMVQTGTPMQQIEKGLLDKLVCLFYLLRERQQQLHRIEQPHALPNFNDESVHVWRASPARHAISAIFLQRFWQMELAYHYQMSQLSVRHTQKWLSCDHTFKSIANVGIVRNADHHWIKQYSGLFCVLNGEGEIVSWKLTKTLQFDEIKEKLCNIQQRLTRQGIVLEAFYVDICCTWRDKLISIFGPQLKVYLDLFHAVQRISKKIPKRHPYPYHFSCMQALKLSFRDNSDQGPVRTKDTPDPATLRANLVAFQKQWEGVAHNGRHILSAAAIKEIRCLLVHVDYGCLSGIPPGHGTNRNERLHKDLNRHMSTSRYGVELAYALLTTAFFQHNEALAARREKRSAKPVAAYNMISTYDVEIEKFGLVFAHVNHDTTVAQMCTQPKTPMVQLQHKVVKEDLELLQQSIQTECEEPDDTLSPIYISSEEAFHILQQAVSAFYVAKELKALSTTAHINTGNLFFVSFMATIEKSMKGNRDGPLDKILSSWNFRRVTVPGDGNCLFTSVTLAMMHRIQNGDSVFINALLAIGLPNSELRNTAFICQFLRNRMVKEWLDNRSFYQGFVTDDILAAADYYQQSGTFSGDLGDLMVLTLANVLQIPITIFTSVENMPILCIMPTTSTMETTSPMFLTYSQSGAGHYDYAVPHESPHELDTTKVEKCSCGRKPNSIGQACSTRRCPCFREATSCSFSCTCKQCNNKYGHRPAPSTTRRRTHYDNQRQELRGCAVHSFMSEVGEPSTTGNFTLLEAIMLKLIIIHFILNGIYLNAPNMSFAYHKVCAVSRLGEVVQFPLFDT